MCKIYSFSTEIDEIQPKILSREEFYGDEENKNVVGGIRNGRTSREQSPSRMNEQNIAEDIEAEGDYKRYELHDLVRISGAGINEKNDGNSRQIQEIIPTEPRKKRKYTKKIKENDKSFLEFRVKKWRKSNNPLGRGGRFSQFNDHFRILLIILF